jgi:hypothetical protein
MLTAFIHTLSAREVRLSRYRPPEAFHINIAIAYFDSKGCYAGACQIALA